jgi:aminoglycoside/choline kinase family phosphotransferase
MISAGLPVTAWDAGEARWIDTGTPETYRDAALDALLPLALERAFGSRTKTDAIRQEPLTGDGSDRRWVRLCRAKGSLVMVDHGIRERPEGTTEADACIRIGRHLHRQGVPVPQIYTACAVSGLVIMEDAGDLHLQTATLRNLQRGPTGHARVMQRYRQIIDVWIHMATAGMSGFDDSWAWQTPAYDRHLILEKECRYFMQAFADGVAGIHSPFSDLLPEFSSLADAALAHGVDGFIHRDFQSRNIMICSEAIRIIDFQGGRRGPIQYDLAALLNDPYVNLPPSLTRPLLDHAAKRAAGALPVDPSRFRTGFHLLSICRLLQALGAYGFLWRIKGKSAFSTYIPVALRRLRRLLAELETPAHPRLTGLIEALASQYPASEGRRHDTGRTP